MQLTKHIAQGHLLYRHNNNTEAVNTNSLSISENQYYRWLAFEDVVQSVMHKRIPAKLTLPHQTAMLLPLLFFRPRLVIELGLGGGNFARFLTHLHGDISFTSIECYQSVIDNFQQYFNPQNYDINIIHQDAALWLTESQSAKIPDWLICDLYHQQLSDAKKMNTLLGDLMDKIDSNSCLSINLPDVSDVEVELCLTILHQLSQHHCIGYFHVPNYLNIVIQVYPKHWRIEKALKNNKQSYLPKRLYLQWRKYWREIKRL
jgi:spermidine synthase